jgi:hypothetical protein
MMTGMIAPPAWIGQGVVHGGEGYRSNQKRGAENGKDVRCRR